MFRLTVILAIVAAASARVPLPTVQIESYQSNNLIDFSDADETSWPLFQLKNSSAANEVTNEASNAFLLADLAAVPSKGKVEGTIRYTLGKRVQNDRLVGYGGDVKNWSTPQDVTLNLRYPPSGQGAAVTYVEIIVGQSTNLGDAKVLAGGIGQHSIALVVTARNTYYLSYVAYFYGI